MKIFDFILGGSAKSKSVARKLWTSSSLPGRLDRVHLRYHHDVAKGGRCQYRTRDSITRVDMVRLIYNCEIEIIESLAHELSRKN